MTNEGCVSKETLLKAFCDNCILAIADEPCANKTNCEEYRNLVEILETLPPVTPLPDKIDGMLEDAYEHGYQQARYDYETQPCGDAVKRESVLNTLDTMDKALDENRTVESYKELLKECYKELPPVTPKQRTGKWIQHGIGFRCSECAIQTSEHNVKSGLMKYCPNCGAKMEGESE